MPTHAHATAAPRSTNFSKNSQVLISLVPAGAPFPLAPPAQRNTGILRAAQREDRLIKDPWINSNSCSNDQ
ncbi:hypothetical protein V500_08154 [Pseudogymnoascus sp. VKM F-4518 (FW-2643)]|nr:hypothetical protein V500_08154 [Pseudogymnoascus sp. VKM F-4518 (FW-2643)]